MNKWALAAFLLAGAGAIGSAQDQKPPERAIPARLAPRSLLLDLAKADGEVVAVGERGHILLSSDAGASWRQADVPTRATLTGVHFQGRSNGWAVGHDSVILRTTDGGASWTRVHWAPEDESPLLDVLFAPDGKKGFAVGAYGSCMITSDGGATWTDQRVSEEDDFHLNQIARSATGRLYVAAEAGVAYRSDDGAATWTRLETPYEGSFFGVLPLEGDAVLLFGLRGHMFRSEDAGANWTPIETGTAVMLNGGVQLGDGRIVIVGLGGTVLISEDGGRSFAIRQQASRGGIQAVVEARNGQLVLAGEFGVRQLPVSGLAKR
jgi:photosystem II stability/assembly factor-like uncharacterized protein